MAVLMSITDIHSGLPGWGGPHEVSLLAEELLAIVGAGESFFRRDVVPGTLPVFQCMVHTGSTRWIQWILKNT